MFWRHATYFLPSFVDDIAAHFSFFNSGSQAPASVKGDRILGKIRLFYPTGILTRGPPQARTTWLQNTLPWPVPTIGIITIKVRCFAARLVDALSSPTGYALAGTPDDLSEEQEEVLR